MNGKLFLLMAAAFGFSGVVFGAFGAHALKSKLSQDMFQIFEVGVRYHMYHALALLCVAWAVTQHGHPFVSYSGWFFVVGILVFSGSLYLLALSGVKAWGAVTPVGGLFFILGWCALFFGVLKS